MPTQPPSRDQQDPTRRAVLRAAGATTATAAAGGLATGVVAQASEYDAPTDIERTYDEEFLRRYQPLLVTSGPAVRENMQGMWGYKVTSPDSDLAVAAYWTKYAQQTGFTIPFTNIALRSDAHYGDHEPSYVYVDESTGEVELVVATGYHHFAAELSGESAPLSSNRAPDRETHVSLRVVDPHHHYQPGEEGRGTFPDLHDFTAARRNWINDGIFDSTALVTVDNPYVMRERDAWWDYDTTDYQFARLWLLLGMRGADERAELRGDVGWFS